MPPVLAFIPAIIGAIASTVPSIVGAIEGGPSTPKPPSAAPTSPLTSAQNRAQTAAVTQTLPNLQELTGGSLSPEYAAQFGATQSGLGNDPQATGNIQEAINKYFGLTAPGDKGFTPSSGSAGGGGGGGIVDLLAQAAKAKGGSSGGAVPGGTDFINENFNADAFRGLAG